MPASQKYHTSLFQSYCPLGQQWVTAILTLTPGMRVPCSAMCEQKHIAHPGPLLQLCFVSFLRDRILSRSSWIEFNALVCMSPLPAGDSQAFRRGTLVNSGTCALCESRVFCTPLAVTACECPLGSFCPSRCPRGNIQWAGGSGVCHPHEGEVTSD